MKHLGRILIVSIVLSSCFTKRQERPYQWLSINYLNQSDSNLYDTTGIKLKSIYPISKQISAHNMVLDAHTDSTTFELTTKIKKDTFTIYYRKNFDEKYDFIWFDKFTYYSQSKLKSQFYRVDTLNTYGYRYDNFLTFYLP